MQCHAAVGSGQSRDWGCSNFSAPAAAPQPPGHVDPHVAAGVAVLHRPHGALLSGDLFVTVAARATTAAAQLVLVLACCCIRDLQ